jgi:hypothetical protein
VGSAGSFRTLLEGGFSLEVFPSNSLNGEQWRLFEPGKDLPHFVVTGIGVEEQVEHFYKSKLLLWNQNYGSAV